VSYYVLSSGRGLTCHRTGHVAAIRALREGGIILFNNANRMKGGWIKPQRADRFAATCLAMLTQRQLDLERRAANIEAAPNQGNPLHSTEYAARLRLTALKAQDHMKALARVLNTTSHSLSSVTIHAD